ncbi:MAG: ribonuclease domain-containing protein [Bacteroidota bacterium]
MLKNYGQLVTGILAGLIIGLFIGKQVFEKTPSPISPVVATPAAQQHSKASVDPVPVPAPTVNNTRHSTHLPQKVYDVLNYIRTNNYAMPGYVGGRVFGNREERLPREDDKGKPVMYHEWDVNAKIGGQNRGTERIITGSDGRAWYTNDHYQSFTEIK